MKKSLLVLVAVLMSVVAMAQAPQKMTYQAVVRDNDGHLVSNGNVGVRITIVRGSETGAEVYSQTETVRTNDNGLFTTMIGGDGFDAIDWSNGPYFMKSEVDPDGGTNYILTTTQQMVSVPYALHAGTVDNIVGGVNITETDPVFTSWDKDYNDLINKPTIPTNVSELNNDAGYLTSFTETQVLSISNDTIYLTGGSYVKLPAGFSGDYNDLANKPNFADSVSRIVNEYHLGDTIINYISQNGYVDSSYVINYNAQQGYVDTTYVTNYINNMGSVTSESDPIFTAWDKDYNDLINRPTIPTSVSELTNDAGYLTSFTEAQVLSISNDTIYLTGGSYVKLPAGFSGDYNDLTNKPTIPTVPTNVSEFTNDAGYITSAGVPTNVSELTNDAGYLTSFTESQILSIGHDTIFLTGGSYVKLPAGFSGDYNDLTNKPTIPTVPTNVSEFTNDAGYLTSFTESQTLANVAAQGNAVETQIKQLGDPTEELDAVNLRTLNIIVNTVVADWSYRFDSLAHRFDSIASSMDSIIAYQDSVIDTLSHLISDINNSQTNAFDANGASIALFSVSATKQVRFSKGNLQYTTTGTHTVSGGGIEAGTWRFAEHQYDTIGGANSNISSSYTGWIDLFGWGTSGWNSGAVAYQPWSNSSISNDYTPGNSYNNNLTSTYARADWGVYNAISNGGNQPGMWRNMTKDEWDYLLNTRTGSTVGGTANARYAKANVDGVCGLIVFPDIYYHPSGIPAPTSINAVSVDFVSNIYTATQWSKMETQGAIFLPTSGYRGGGGGVGYVGTNGSYWTSDYKAEGSAYGVYFKNTNLNIGYYVRSCGLSVRLVRDGDRVSMATVTTSTVSNITANSANCGGNVSDDGGATVTARGVCWSTSHNPTVSDSHTTDGNGTGGFSSSITGLSASTTYYVRAYATNSEGTAYGTEQSFTTEAEAVGAFDENGASNAVFTVAAGRTVKFSRGNLQYTTTGTHTVSGGGTETGTWRFAEHQYDTIGGANSNISSSYTGWIDLFEWGTSGWNSGANAYQPWATSSSYSDSYPGGSYTNNLTGTYARADWGVYNAISNGGNQPGMWRTMTYDEWDYLITTRSASTVGGTANARYAKATVNGTSGVIIFPDTFTLPTGMTVTNVNNSSGAYTSNTYTSSQWGQLEAAGCIFLPAAGYRYGTEVDNVGTNGYYWSSTCYGESTVYYMHFNDDDISVSNYIRHRGRSVRLVRD